MRIITIGREFGSGGRELGKRLADELGIPCYDKTVIHEVAKLHGFAEDYVESVSLSDIRTVYPATIGSTFGTTMYYNNSAAQALVAQQNVIKKLAAKGDCVFVGRAADAILEDMNPLNLFVYASKESKVKRCLARAKDGETEKMIIKQMAKIDKSRARTRSLMADTAWGRKESYHLCINTSDVEIKTLIPTLAAYVNCWFDMQEKNQKVQG